MELKLVDLTLENVSDGALEGRFQELLAEIADINENALSYVGGSDGVRKSVIKLEVELRYRPSLGGDPVSILIISGGEISTRPKRVKSAQPAHVAPDGNLVVIENPPAQMSAFDGEGSGGVVSRIDRAANGETSDDGK